MLKLKMLIPCVCLLAGSLLAGGFYIQLGNPAENTEAKSKNAVLVAQLTGCHEAEKGSMEASAEGIVNGKRRSIPLEVSTLSTPGMFAIQQSWPNEGTWVVKMLAKHPAFPNGTSAIVRVNGAQFERTKTKWVMRAATEAEVEQVLALRD